MWLEKYRKSGHGVERHVTALFSGHNRFSNAITVLIAGNQGF